MIQLSLLTVHHTHCLIAFPTEHAQLQVLELFQAVQGRYWKLALLKCFGSGTLTRQVSMTIYYNNVDSSIATQTCSDFHASQAAGLTRNLQRNLSRYHAFDASTSELQQRLSSYFCQLLHVGIQALRCSFRLILLECATILSSKTHSLAAN